MNRLFTTSICVFLCSFSFAQVGLKSSSINSAGGFKFQNEGRILVMNATSQSSSISIHKSSNLQLRQGFIQPISISNTFGVVEITIYPNPSDGLITIDLEGKNENVELTIFDLQGKSILSKSIRAGEEIDLTHLKKGFYQGLIKQYGSYLGSRKIIIQ